MSDAESCTLIEGVPDGEAARILDAAAVKAAARVTVALRLTDENARLRALRDAFEEGMEGRTGRIDQACLFAEVARRAAHAERPSATVLTWRPRGS